MKHGKTKNDIARRVEVLRYIVTETTWVRLLKSNNHEESEEI